MRQMTLTWADEFRSIVESENDPLIVINKFLLYCHYQEKSFNQRWESMKNE